MRFALMSEPQQGLSYDEILALARTAEEAGLEAYFRSDHYASFPGESGLPTTDAWATLAGLARETSRIGLGTLVSPVTFRIPGNLAKVVQTVDQMSGGRVEVGLGAGWNDAEHAQLGIPFPPLAERYEMLEEQLAILHGLWTEPDGWSFEGRHWQVRDAKRHGAVRSGRDGERRHPHLVIGGEGKERMARLVAEYADEINIVSASPEKVEAAYGRVREACRRIGRDPDEIVYSAMTGVLVAETESELRDRVRDVMSAVASGGDPEQWLAARRERWIMGVGEAAWERVRALEGAGVRRIMLQDFIPRDLDHVRVMGRLFG
jgi:F420-dependent oxidoreductase-like protein